MLSEPETRNMYAGNRLRCRDLVWEHGSGTVPDLQVAFPFFLARNCPAVSTTSTFSATAAAIRCLQRRAVFFRVIQRHAW